jgi:hypothetical protein
MPQSASLSGAKRKSRQRPKKLVHTKYMKCGVCAAENTAQTKIGKLNQIIKLQISQKFSGQPSSTLRWPTW